MKLNEEGFCSFKKKKIVEKIFSAGYISSSKISPILQFEGFKCFVLVKILQKTKNSTQWCKTITDHHISVARVIRWIKLVNTVFIKLFSWTSTIFTSKLLSGTPEKSCKKCLTLGMEWGALLVKAKCSLPCSACQFCNGIMTSCSKQKNKNKMAPLTADFEEPTPNIHTAAVDGHTN